MGIPAVGIVDIDVIKEGGQVYNKVLDGIFIPPINRQSFCDQRIAIHDAFKVSGKDMKRNGGIKILGQSEQEGCVNFCEQLEQYGSFIVRNGELESWLSILAIETNKSTWLVKIFERMGEDPNDENYLSPSDGDVWDFIGRIKKWIDDPKRKGIPQ